MPGGETLLLRSALARDTARKKNKGEEGKRLAESGLKFVTPSCHLRVPHCSWERPHFDHAFPRFPPISPLARQFSSRCAVTAPREHRSRCGCPAPPSPKGCCRRAGDGTHTPRRCPCHRPSPPEKGSGSHVDTGTRSPRSRTPNHHPHRSPSTQMYS